MKPHIIPDIVQNQKICEIPAEGTALEAAKQMVDCNVAAICVVDGEGNLKGIVTERDLTRRVVAEGRDAKTVKLADIMTAKPDTLSPGDTAQDALELMRERRYRHLPVTDDGRIVGMVSMRDLYAAVKVDLEDNIRETEAFVFGDRYGA